MFPPSQMSSPQVCGNMLLSPPPCTDIKAGSGLADTLLPTTISSIANLSSCMKDGKNEEGCKCACSAVDVTEPLCQARTAAVKQNNVCVCLYSGIELDKLDSEMIKLLAWQRIQQLFPPKIPSTPTPPATTAAPKSPPPLPDSKSLAQPMKLRFTSVFPRHFLLI